MAAKQRQHSGAFKAQVALEAIRGERTVNAIAMDCGVHPVQSAYGTGVIANPGLD